MQTMEEKYAELLGEAEKALAEAPEAWSAVSLAAADGRTITAARPEGTIATWRADLDLTEKLQESGNARVTALVCLCKGGTLEMPGWHLASVLKSLDPENAAATVLLRGKTLTERTI